MFDQINAAFLSIREFFHEYLKKNYQPKDIYIIISV